MDKTKNKRLQKNFRLIWIKNMPMLKESPLTSERFSSIQRIGFFQLTLIIELEQHLLELRKRKSFRWKLLPIAYLYIKNMADCILVWIIKNWNWMCIQNVSLIKKAGFEDYLFCLFLIWPMAMKPILVAGISICEFQRELFGR